MWVSGRITVIGLLLCACTPSAPAADPAHARDVAAWRAERLERLLAPTGWLTLVGLDWLKAGQNSIGSDPAGAVVLPKRMSSRVGVISYKDTDGQVRLTFAPAGRSGFNLDGVVVDASIPMRPDSGGSPTTLHRDGVRFYVIERNGRYGVRIKDEKSTVRRDFAGIEAFPVDSSWRVSARFEPYDPPRRVAIPSVLGGSSVETVVGAAVFDRAGATHRLELQGKPGDTELFVVFGDRTNRRETYGAGRFLVADLDAGTQTVFVDFNRAYNPPCSFTPYATCPLPPRQNVLDLAIRAGERRYGKAH